MPMAAASTPSPDLIDFLKHQLMEQESKAHDFYSYVMNSIVAHGFDFVTSIVLLLVGWYLAKWVQRSLRTRLARAKNVDLTLGLLLANSARYAILLFVLIAALSKMGIQTTSLIAIVGAAGLAIGLALQSTLSNIAAGLMLVILRPFKIGDHISTPDIEDAMVKEINLFTTEVTTLDGKRIFVPNGNLWQKSITNYTSNKARRIDFYVSISYTDDIDAACDALRAALEANEFVKQNPPPLVAFWSFLDSGLQIHIRAWCEPSRFIVLRSTLPSLVKRTLEAAGCVFPFPHRVVISPSGQS